MRCADCAEKRAIFFARLLTGQGNLVSWFPSSWAAPATLLTFVCCSYSNYCLYGTYCFCFPCSSYCSYLPACMDCLGSCFNLAFSSCQKRLRIWQAAPRLGANTYHTHTHRHIPLQTLLPTHSCFTPSHTHAHRLNTPYVHRLAKAASASPTPFTTANAFCCCCCCCWRGSITSLCIVTMVTFLIKFYFMPPFWRLPHAPTPHLPQPRVCGENLWRCMRSEAASIIMQRCNAAFKFCPCRRRRRRRRAPHPPLQAFS